MFSFHRPKTYRSAKGCCICKAKSSSSRFTDSKKYESEFVACFNVKDNTGDICNACVLLVKRYKKLPVNSGKNWHHVVDARAGPGTKTFMKYNSKLKLNKRSSRKIRTKIRPPINSGGLSDDVSIGDECMSDQSNSLGCAPASVVIPPSSVSSEGSDDSLAISPAQPRRQPRRQRMSNPTKLSSFLDMNIWKKQKVCCGTVFDAFDGVLIIDYRFYKPCAQCKSPQRKEEVSDNSNMDQPDNSIANENNGSIIVDKQLLAVRNQESPMNH